MNFDSWPNCAKEGCPNKCCLRLHSIYCYPHTLGLPTEPNAGSQHAEECEEAVVGDTP